MLPIPNRAGCNYCSFLVQQPQFGALLVATERTIAFDLDGTLADTIHDLVAALNRTLQRNGLAPFASSEVAHFTGKGGLRSMIAHGFERIDMQLDQRDLAVMFADTVEDYDQNIAVETELYPGVRASLEDFRKEGWLLAVCTNKPVRQAKKLLNTLEIDHHFAAVTGAGSFEFKKPDPRHLLRTIELAGGTKQRAVMVGDTQADFLTAQRAHIPVVAVDFGYSDILVEQFAPDRVISSFGALYAEASALVR